MLTRVTFQYSRVMGVAVMAAATNDAQIEPKDKIAHALSKALERGVGH